MRTLSNPFTRHTRRCFSSGRPNRDCHPILGLRCQKSKRVMRRHQETVTNFGTGFSRVVKRLFVQIPIREGTDDVTRFRHRAPVIFRRESKRRCFSSQ